jgi:hypothetical protein
MSGAEQYANVIVYDLTTGSCYSMKNIKHPTLYCTTLFSYILDAPTLFSCSIGVPTLFSYSLGVPTLFSYSVGVPALFSYSVSFIYAV